MPEGLVPRMAIEWGFLILLAVGAAVADLQTVYIILVVAIGWILVALVEVLSWRARPHYAVVAEELPPPPVERALESVPPPPLAQGPRAIPAPSPPPEEQTAVVWAEADKPDESVPEASEPEKAEQGHDPNDPFAPAPERENLQSDEQRSGLKLEPLKPRPARKYRWFGPFKPREDDTPGGTAA